MIQADAQFRKQAVLRLLVAPGAMEHQTHRVILIKLLTHTEVHGSQRVEFVAFTGRHHLFEADTGLDEEMIVPFLREVLVIGLIAALEHHRDGIHALRQVLRIAVNGVILRLVAILTITGRITRRCQIGIRQRKGMSVHDSQITDEQYQQ